jgi:hypothetical protein
MSKIICGLESMTVVQKIVCFTALTPVHLNFVAFLHGIL